ncbi:hypothetical protein BGZ61DRAFT_477893 [Ilyonectria robusta]|uniref:uncharacterized protein n=1 Tax=Ilyonectria robusta TaxID=1079257 RepID=UPI001E8E7D65|nr:uncharacterized protein BGZ61DRAFT_477893 [Ilyonectria robusta]KAH8699944.1 hypothetical protein BGZ61DRAFT_477893 [Ilyonectria robusta]
MDLEGAWSGVGSLDDLSLLERNVGGRCKRDGACICKSGIGLGQGCLGYRDRSKEGSRGRHCWVAEPGAQVLGQGARPGCRRGFGQPGDGCMGGVGMGRARCKVLGAAVQCHCQRPGYSSSRAAGTPGAPGAPGAPFGLRARAVIPCRMLEHPLTPAGIEAGTTTPQPSKPPRNGTWSGAPGRQRMGFGCGKQAPSSLPVALWVIARPEREHGVVYSVPSQRWLACQRERP